MIIKNNDSKIKFGYDEDVNRDSYLDIVSKGVYFVSFENNGEYLDEFYIIAKK